MDNCTGEAYTYERMYGLAETSLSLVQDDIVIYERANQKGTFYYCCLSAFEERKGEIITILKNPRKK